MSAQTSLAQLYDRYVDAWAARDPDAIVALDADATFAALPDFGFEVHRTEFGPRQ